MHATAKPRKPRPDSYHKVFDSRKRRVRGLWQRNGHYYANLTVSDDLGRKTSQFVPLNGVGLAEAKADYDRLKVERDDDRLRPLGLTPKLSDYFKDSYSPNYRCKVCFSSLFKLSESATNFPSFAEVF
jgi:hypothetical protein